MGNFFSDLFGGGKQQPTYTPPPPPTLPTAQELYSQALSFGNQNMPMAMGAREGALTDLQNPTAYYSGFQPTSFEQALGNQHFQNVWPNTEAYMANVLSKSGMAYSPTAAATLGKEYGNLSQSIGQYLSDQGNARATNSLNGRLQIDPMAGIMNPYANIGQQQGNTQAQLQYGYQQAQAMNQYHQQMNQYQQQGALAGTLGSISPLGGAIYGGATGHLGDALGGTSSSMNAFAPALMYGMTGGFGGMFGGGSGAGGGGLMGDTQGFGGGTSVNWVGAGNDGWSLGASNNPYSGVSATSTFGQGLNGNWNPGAARNVF